MPYVVEAFEALTAAALMNLCALRSETNVSLPSPSVSINGDVIGGAALKDVARSGEGKRAVAK